ncbi:MAG: cyclic nucleotide-binding domain-containing protein [Mariprofundaceae bacterium]
MPLLNTQHVSGSFRLEPIFLIKLFIGGLLTALGVYEMGMHLELSFAAFVFIPLFGLFFTWLKREGDGNFFRIFGIAIVAIMIGMFVESFFMAIAAFMLLEGGTHRDSISRHDEFRWMKLADTDITHDKLDQLVDKHLLFESIPKDQRIELTRNCTVIEVDPGTALIQQGVFNYNIYLIGKGEVDIISDKEHVTSLYEGDIVGEISTGTIRLPIADVIAKTDVVAFAFPIDTINELSQKHPEFAQKMLEIGMLRIQEGDS